jgi:DNA-binding winged helix-turn-helix (wHTH) protein/Tol biopolymer transport system component
MLPENPNGIGAAGGVPARRSRHIFRFGAFELRSETGQLSKHGIRIKVQTKPIQVLEALLARPGELVTREELCKKLWPAGTFVDFENGLNTATNRLRTALGDSAEAPRYIETVPRLGYRFIFPFVKVDENESAAILPNVGLQLDTTEHNLPSADVAGLSSQTPSSLRTYDVGLRRSGNYELRSFSGIAAVSLVLVVFAALVFGYVHLKVPTRRLHPAFRQLTFRAGVIGSARFSADFKNVIYTAKWGGGNRQTYLLDVNSFHSQVLAFAPGALVSVSRKGDLAFLSRNPSLAKGSVRLSRVSVNGGAAQVIAEGTKSADWAPNGRELAIVREVGPDSLLEFPAGNVVYSSHGWIDCLRVSSGGDQVAFLEHSVRDDDAGHVRLVDKNGNTRVLTDDWSSAEGLAWSPSGEEVWFTASKKGAARALYAISKTGQLRQVSKTPSSLRLLDLSSTGRVLMAVDDIRMTLRSAPGVGSAERDLSHFDFSHADDISSDGNLVLFTEGGDGGGQHYETYVQDVLARSTFLVAQGRGLAISPDEKSVLTVDPQDRTHLTLTSIASQHSTKVLGDGFEYQWAKFLPDGKRLLVGGAYTGELLTICTQTLDGGKPAPVNGLPYMDFVAVSPDGMRIAGATTSDAGLVFDLANHSARQLSPGLNALPIAWTLNNRDLYAVNFRDSVYRIIKTNPTTGKVELWKTITLGDQAGVIGLAGLVIAPATGAYAYSTNLNLSRLYLVDGWS